MLRGKMLLNQTQGSDAKGLPADIREPSQSILRFQLPFWTGRHITHCLLLWAMHGNAPKGCNRKGGMTYKRIWQITRSFFFFLLIVQIKNTWKEENIYMCIHTDTHTNIYTAMKPVTPIITTQQYCFNQLFLQPIILFMKNQKDINIYFFLTLRILKIAK